MRGYRQVGSLVLVYLSSTLYHGFRRPRLKRLFQIFDHSAIYLLIAAEQLLKNLSTSTLLCIASGGGASPLGLLFLAWRRLSSRRSPCHFTAFSASSEPAKGRLRAFGCCDFNRQGSK